MKARAVEANRERLTLSAQHRGLDGGQDLQLGPDRGDPLADLQQTLEHIVYTPMLRFCTHHTSFIFIIWW